jgi:hypothetical protein
MRFQAALPPKSHWTKVALKLYLFWVGSPGVAGQVLVGNKPLVTFDALENSLCYVMLGYVRFCYVR